jgi:uncharacterized protein (TIGR00251 family)
LSIRIIIDVKPNSNSESVEKIYENHYLVKVKAPAKKGKANLAVTKLLNSYFGKKVILVGGWSSRRKYFIILE